MVWAQTDERNLLSKDKLIINVIIGPPLILKSSIIAIAEGEEIRCSISYWIFVKEKEVGRLTFQVGLIGPICLPNVREVAGTWNQWVLKKVKQISVVINLTWKEQSPVVITALRLIHTRKEWKSIRNAGECNGPRWAVGYRPFGSRSPLPTISS